MSADFVEKNLSGIETLDISLISAQEEAFKRPDNLKYVEKIQTYTDSLEGIDKTLSFVDFIKDMNQSFHNENPEYLSIPDSKELISQYLLLYDSDDLNDYVNPTFNHAKISVRISEHSTGDQERIINRLKEYVGQNKMPGIEIRITGRTVQVVNTVDGIVKGQVYSLATATIIIAVIMFFILKSFLMGIISVIPNLFPIAVNFGIMGFWGIPLNTATALIAAVAIGIAVDDTIHFLSEFKNKLSTGSTVSESVALSITTKGKAIALSSFILCIGFGVMSLSNFIPTVNFGILSALIMITALIGDIVVLPSLALLVSSTGLDFYKTKEKYNE